MYDSDRLWHYWRNKMIGRKNETAILERAAASPRSEFVAVYGRRRIGKTYLIRKTFGSRLLFSHAGVENVEMDGQLRAFRSSLRDAGVDSCRKLGSWFDAFDALKDLVRDSSASKKILFLDELPWMDTPKSNFVPARNLHPRDGNPQGRPSDACRPLGREARAPFRHLPVCCYLGRSPPGTIISAFSAPSA